MESESQNSRIFTNAGDNTLIREFAGVLANAPHIKNLDALVGFLRASGYFALRPFLDNISHARILVGIDVDKYIVEANRRGQLYFGDPDKIKEDFLELIRKDIEKAGYKKDIEDGIFQMVEDLQSGKLQLRAHPSRRIHAKFYLLYPENFNQWSSGMLITGSSNLTGNGLGIAQERQYEFNVKLSDFSDVNFAKQEFERLWQEAEGCDIVAPTVQHELNKTYLGKDYTPYEIYIKTLMEFFAKRIVEADTLDPFDLPEGYTRYEYQTDAVIEGYQMLKRYDGFFLADVVGLGKTIVATMIAKRFLFENGIANTKILVVYPPAVEQNWKLTFQDFNMDKYTRFISNGSLSKVLDPENYNYWNAEDYDLIIVDEAHRFRSNNTEAFENLQAICKKPRKNPGNVGGSKKKVMLISATPMNNSPADIYNQLLLFQDARRCTIDGVPNLASFFSPIITEFQRLRRENAESKEYQSLSKKVRDYVIKPITIRRTRTDIESIPRYRKDFAAFPKVAPPRKTSYELNTHVANLFVEAMDILTQKLTYARYQAIAYLKPEAAGDDYEKAELTSRNLAAIRKNGLVKRLESSFYAFKVSLNCFRKANQNMIEMFNKDKVYIAPDLDINKMFQQMENGEITEEDIDEQLRKKAEDNPMNQIFGRDDFNEDFLPKLLEDQSLLDSMCMAWNEVKEEEDSKFATFKELIQHELFSTKINKGGKLVVFSESIDTLNYLERRLREIGRTDLLAITSHNRKTNYKAIRENFDANHTKQLNDINILLATDVLSEGVNLHRANVIVNYDTPWNSTRLMQRIGRVNRIGSTAEHIHNYVFYPSREGNEVINLESIALGKIQVFHSTFGEDSKIFSQEEIIDRNLDHLFDEAINESQEEKNMELPFYEELLDLYKNHRKEYERIAQLPPRSRTGRNAREVEGVTLSGDTLVFLKVNECRKFFLVSDTAARELDEVEALNYFKASPEEPCAPRLPQHHDHVQKALTELNDMMRKDAAAQESMRGEMARNKQSAQTTTALSLLNSLSQHLDNDDRDRLAKLRSVIEHGTLTSLVQKLQKMHRQLSSQGKNRMTLDEALAEVKLMAIKYEPYYTEEAPTEEPNMEEDTDVILSESFTQL